jgi:precorrin-6Y C5,15-methyltransferase (decarboxylating)
MNPIEIIGIGADGPASLRREAIERIEAADFLAGGERHLAHFSSARGHRFIIKDNLVLLVEELSMRHLRQRCVVLASGDPLFHGVGTKVTGVFGSDHVRVEPALSSMQLAFARIGQSWQKAALASIHGRALRSEVLPLLGKKLVGLFTTDGNGPAAVAQFFLRHDLPGYEAAVAENLGTNEERLTRWPDLQALKEQRFAPLNYLILLRKAAAVSGHDAEHYRSMVPGVPDSAFCQPESAANMTSQEVRSVLLGKMGGVLQPGDTVWDIGAGLGTVSVEIAVLRPDVEVVAVERDRERVAFIRQNRERFDAYNVRIIEGSAPQALVYEQDSPRLIFLGGSGSQLPGILDDVEQRLRAGGRLLANFVTLENLMTAFLRFSGKGWQVEITEVNVARSDALGGHTGLKPQRGVFMLKADKPGARP